MNQPWDWVIHSEDTKTFQRYPSIYRTSALRDTDTMLDENDMKATNQDDVNTERIPEPMANALSSRGPRKRDQTTAEMH